MNTIFAVSRDYIEPLYSNAQKYDFKLQAYSDFSQAKKGLSFVNKCDIIGIAILDDDIYDVDGFVSFVKYIKLLGDVPLTIILNKKSKTLEKLPPMGIVAAVDVSQEFFTDITINKDVFGALLLKRFEPYLIHQREVSTVKYEIPTIHYQPLFSPAVLKVLTIPNFTTTLSENYNEDSIYAELKDKNSLLACLRLLYLKKWLGENDYKLRNEVEEEIEKIEDADLYCLYSAVLYEIGGV